MVLEIVLTGFQILLFFPEVTLSAEIYQTFSRAAKVSNNERML